MGALKKVTSEPGEPLRLVPAGGSDGIWDWNIATGEVRFSARGAELLGYDPDDLGQHSDAWERLVHPDDREALTQAVTEHLEGRAPDYRSEHRVLTQAGEWKWILDRGKVVERDEQGQPLRAAGTHTDITERKHAELKLADSEARYRGLVESQLDLVVRVNSAGQLVFVNEAYCAKFGKARAELLGTTFMPLVHPDDLPATLEAMKGLQTPPYRIHVEQRAMTVEGWRWLTWEDHAIRDGQGRTVEIQAIGRDITERKVTEEQLVAQRDLAQGLAVVASLDVALPICLDIAIRVSKMDCGGIYLVDRASGDLNLVCTRGLSVQFIESTKHWPAQSDRTRLIMAGESIYARYEHVNVTSIDLAEQEGLRALAVQPIVHRGRVIGCFNLGSHVRNDVPPTCRQTLEIIVSHVGSAIARIEAEEAWRNSQQEWQALFNSLHDFLFVLDTQGRILYVNQMVLKSLGYAEAELLGQDVLMLHPPDLRAEAAATIVEMVAGRRESCPLSLQTRSGALIPVETKVTHGRWGHRDALFGVSRDVSGRRQVEADLQTANTSLRAGLDELRQRNSEGGLLSEMAALLQVCTRAEEAYEVIRRQLLALFPGEVGALYIAESSGGLVEARLQWGLDGIENGLFAMEECWGVRRGRAHLAKSTGDLSCPHVGSPAPEVSLCVPIVAQGETLGVLHLRGRASEFTEARQHLAQTVADTMALALANLKLRETLRQQSIRDPLTGLFNRRCMEETLARELTRARRTQQSLGIIMVDIDHFKQFNDTHGHKAGDLVLRELGALLQAQVRAGDIGCRYGGEEFLLILPGASLEVALQRAEQLREKAKEARLVHDGEVLGQLALSGGVAMFPTHGESVDALMRAADVAMYAAKRAGRDQICIACNGTGMA